MLKIHKQHKAEEDLVSIWLYTFENWGSIQADNYLDQIDVALMTIASNPEIGVNIDTIRHGYKKFQVNHHIIFYKVKTTKIQVIRLLGNDMDYKNHL